MDIDAVVDEKIKERLKDEIIKSLGSQADDKFVAIIKDGETTPIENMNEVLSRIVRICRIRAGLKQAERADAIHRSQSEISKYETGERVLSIEILKEICEVTNSRDAL